VRKFMLAILGVALFATIAFALDIRVRSFCDDVGVRLSPNAGKITMQPGQTLTVKVSQPPRLAAYGLSPTSIGDEVSITYNNGKSFTIKHLKSGKQVTVSVAAVN
jgi:hypothetical protein